jgi:hypothetical protein
MKPIVAFLRYQSRLAVALAQRTRPGDGGGARSGGPDGTIARA